MSIKESVYLRAQITQLLHSVELLAREIAKLQNRIAAIEAKKPPGRPRKEDARI